MADVTATIRSQFGAVAAAYAASAVHASGPDLEAMLAAAALRGDERVLDLGSGAGHTAFAFARRAASVVGIDLTPAMVATATALAAERGRGNLAFAEGDVARLPFAEGSFDVVTSRLSAHHYADPQAALREARRVLRAGGRFLLVDTVAPEDPALDTFCNTFEFLRDPSHVRNWRASEWVRLCAAAGIRAEVVHRGGIPLDGADWVRRMRTPPSRVAMLQELFREATPAQRAAFELRDEPWGLTVPVALVVGVAGAA